MVQIFIDDKAFEAEDGKNLLEVCLSLGFNLPYFCWHPALHSVGACRQCGIILYKDEEDKKGKLVMACMQAATDQTRISIDDPRARDFRSGNIEALMVNHPHDCPVCDEGGECHLQDMTLMSGHNYRRYQFKKRTHVSQYLGPFIHHEMNRCIQCYRCIRYYKDYAGGKDLDVFAAHDDVYFGRHEEGVLENEFSGNLVEICPTGVFTDKTLRQHYTRKWDLTSAPSICHQCGLGCNIITSERYGKIRRVLSRYNGAVNGYFICDRGRFGYDYTNSDKRITHPMKRHDGIAQQLTKSEALAEIRAITVAENKVLGIGSPRASLESNYLLRSWVGEANFYGGITNEEGALLKLILDILKTRPVRVPSLREVETYDAVFILGEDVTNTAPMLALSLRQAAKNQPRELAQSMKISLWNDAAVRAVVQGSTGPFYIAATHATKLDDIATHVFRSHPDDIARLGYAVIHQLNHGRTKESDRPRDNALSASIAKALLSAKKPLIVAGMGLYSKHTIQAAADLACALKEQKKDVGLIYAVPEVNTMGLGMLTGQYLDDMIAVTEKNIVDTLVILENNLFRRWDRNKLEMLWTRCRHIVVLDSLHNDTTSHGEYVLPAGTFAESEGTLMNNEGRIQRFYSVYVPENEVSSSWRWLDELRLDHLSPHQQSFDDILAEMVSHLPELAGIQSLSPSADFRVGTQKIPREPHRYSGRTAMHAQRNVHESKPPVDPDSALSYTMEGFQGIPPGSLVPYFWSPGWNSVQAINKYQIEIGGPLQGGNPGLRLLEPVAEGRMDYFDSCPQSFSPRGEQWLVLPFYHIFGSDELSAESPAMAERLPNAYIAMNTTDAQKVSITESGERIELSFDDERMILPVQLDDSIPLGLAGVPHGFKETQGMSFPFWTALKKINNE